MNRLNIIVLISIIFFVYPNNICAQKSYDKNFYGGLFYLSRYMCSNEYLQFRINHSDLESVDNIYNKALVFFDGDVSESLFCLTFVALPFNKILMKVPLISTIVSIPLPSPPQYVFEMKKKNTPKKLFADSPTDDFGDKDKLAHFFGNAFIHYNSGVFNLSKFLGIFVEYFEQGFFLQGGYDYRDLVANHLGEFFAEMVKTNPYAKPSEALMIYQLLYFKVYQ